MKLNIFMSSVSIKILTNHTFENLVLCLKLSLADQEPILLKLKPSNPWTFNNRRQLYGMALHIFNCFFFITWVDVRRKSVMSGETFPAYPRIQAGKRRELWEAVSWRGRCVVGFQIWICLCSFILTVYICVLLLFLYD